MRTRHRAVRGALPRRDGRDHTVRNHPDPSPFDPDLEGSR
jgi:hypothetical protein